MLHGAIPIATKRCFPEVLGSAGMLVNQTVNSIISSVTKLLMNDKLRSELKSKSYERQGFLVTINKSKKQHWFTTA